MKKLALLLFISALLYGCGSSGSNKKSNSPTSFATCDEFTEYAKWFNYSDLKAKWGEGQIGEPWDASATGELDMMVSVTWSNVTCNGKPAKIDFINSHSSVSDAFSKSPSSFFGIVCDDYK